MNTILAVLAAFVLIALFLKDLDGRKEIENLREDLKYDISLVRHEIYTLKEQREILLSHLGLRYSLEPRRMKLVQDDENPHHGSL